MIRRISTKWVLAVLAAVVVPFVGFAWYVDLKLADRLSNDIVRYYLLRFADDLADRIDDELAERRSDIELLSEDAIVTFSLEEEPDAFREPLENHFDRIVRRLRGFDLLLVVDDQGKCIAASSRMDRGSGPDEVLRESLKARDYSDESWFAVTLGGDPTLVDHHVSPLLYREMLSGSTPAILGPEHYGVGIASPIRSLERPDEVLGVLYGLLNWTVIQEDLLDAYRETQGFEGIGSEIYASSYSWLWMADANTIIGHPKTELYGKHVAEDPVNLPQLVAAASAAEWGMFPEYEFGGVLKHAAFRHCNGPEQGGLGWVVGIGIDNTEIYATVTELNDLLINATIVVLLVVVLWTVFIARRTTRPILELQRHTRRVAAGDLEARIAVQSHDELGALARDFNQMSEELLENRTRLVQAEKESAWREMARQVAHEIKNPLTPISLSVNLLRRARDEGSEEFDAILDRTIDLIQRQVDNMRRITEDFYAFAGEQALEPRDVDLRGLVEEVLELNAAWAAELGVEISVTGPRARVWLDPAAFRRVLINLVSNALEAMPEGGLLEISLTESAEQARVVIRDSGQGIDEAVLEHLFEPYFTTRSHGTGLGLAICKRIIDALAGEIRISSVPESEGSGTLVEIVLPPAGADDGASERAGD
jgi:signal transduction histidine kinase